MRILLLILWSLANLSCSQKIENQPAVTQTIPQQEFEPTVYQLIDFFLIKRILKELTNIFIKI
ncbi:hypothetical protein A9G35_01700 [Gilliamella sp. Choc5-1]|nr:hypothetical protein A9G35_01700 [Gilliamella apicola]